MEIHHSSSQNTISFLVEKIFPFKVDSFQKECLNPRPDTVFRDLRSDRGGGATPLAFPNEAS